MEFARQLVELGRGHGTPLYVYDLERLERNARRTAEAVGAAGTRIHFFEFANRNPEILGRVREIGFGLTVARPAGIVRALRAGFPPEDVELSGFGLSDDDLRAAADAGVAVNLGSISELARAAAVLPEARIGLRVDLAASTLDKRGVPVPEALEFLARRTIRVRGLHTYIGSNRLSPRAHLDALERLVELACALPAPLRRKLDYVNVGGGFGYDYANGGHFAWAEYGAAARAILDEAERRLGRRLVLKLEVGRDLVVDCGYLLTKVLHAFEKNGRLFLVVDSNLSHFGRPAWYGFCEELPPHVTDGRHRLKLLGAPSAPAAGVQAAVVGNSHYSRDWFGFVDAPAGDPARLVGSHVVVLDAGAYGEAMSDQWADEPRPAVVVVEGNSARLVTRREDVLDLVGSPRQVVAPAAGSDIAAVDA
jgi:diaminopimelate decarboxylase